MNHLRSLLRCSICAAALSLLTACHDGASQSSTTPPTGDDIQGIEMPSSVAVVTATNAD